MPGRYRMRRIRHQRSVSGFTLIEIAISLVIVGILFSSAFYAYSLYLIKKESTKTLEAVSAAATALYEFKNANGRYPCPSPILEQKDTSLNYGHETDCSDKTIGTGTIVPPGRCLTGTTLPDNYNGICIESSLRTILGVNPRVRVGAIPFRDLQIDEKNTIDGYGSRLVYAVTEDMAVAATYKDTIAGIEIRDGSGNVLSGGDRSVAFLVLSPGKNKNGAVDISGRASPCLTTAADIDGENCRDFTSLTNTQAVYVMDAHASGTNRFDDIVEYFVPTGGEVWRRETNTSENIIDMSEDKVGVGITSPLQLTDDLTIKQSTLENVTDMAKRGVLAATNTLNNSHQSGGLRVGKYSGGKHDGKILADSYCTEDGSACFTTDMIAGEYDGNPTSGTSGMGCDTAAGQYMVGIEKGRAKCGPIRLACPPGQVVTGTNWDGSANCSTPAVGCLAKNVLLCGETYTLPSAGDGQRGRVDYNTGGACAYTIYECNAGVWNGLGWASYDSPAACSYRSTSIPTGSKSVACGQGFSGSYTQNYYLNCMHYERYTTNDAATSCVCVGETSNVECSSEFKETVVGTKKRVCTGNTLDTTYTIFKDNLGNSYPSEAALLSATCTCAKPDYWEFEQCGYGKERAGSPNPASFVSPSSSWPADASYGVFRKRTADPLTCTYDLSAYDYTNCVCSSGYNFREVNPTCGSCDEVDVTEKIRQVRSGASCDWIDDPDTSANTAGTCKPRTFIWKSSGSMAGPSNPLADGHGTSPLCGSSCSCGESGSQSSCTIATASQWTYFKSTCQPR